MERTRQLAFQKLKPPCVELSRVALQFRGHQCTSRQVHVALGNVLRLLSQLGQSDALDEKLAEYAFYPLQLVFNETKRISSSCLELAVKYLQVLVTKGWRAKINPEMGKQLLILLSLLAGAAPGKSSLEAPSEELTLAALNCMNDIVKALGQANSGNVMFNEQGTRTLVDQIVYMLLDAITDSPSSDIQLAALKTLLTVYCHISNRVLLASLLPRTVSSLTKVLRSNTQVRRTYKVLIVELQILTGILRAVLNDRASHPESLNEVMKEKNASQVVSDSGSLDASWLEATSSQVKLALTHIVQLRYHERTEVRKGVMELCLMVIEECATSLADSTMLMIETLVVLAGSDVDIQLVEAEKALSHLVSSNTAIFEMLRDRLRAWASSFSRVMQGNDDRSKQRVLQNISTAFSVLSRIDTDDNFVDDTLSLSLCDGLASALPKSLNKPAEIEGPLPSSLVALASSKPKASATFSPILLGQRSEEGTLHELQSLISAFSKSEASSAMTRTLLARASISTGQQKTAAIWLALKFLSGNERSDFELSDFIDVAPKPISASRPYLIEELYSLTLPDLLAPAAYSDWQMSALSLEALILQAQQLGHSYRPELMESLYPVLQLLGSSNRSLQNHAITSLNLLASACEYENVSDMLISNVDYLINSVGLKLTYGDVSPQAAQVLLMMVRLCGASLIPYLDDTIYSIFDLLDQYHGYPKLVEMLFEVLGAVVNEGAEKPHLAITSGREAPQHKKPDFEPSSIDDIIEDIRRHKDRSSRQDPTVQESGHDDTPISHPKRPWTSAQDGPPRRPVSSGSASPSENEDENDEDDALPPPEDKPPPLSSSHSLLLSILNACPPHLSSPSPHVRLTILNLITRVVPLLASDETTLLPAIHAIWPSIVARLFPPDQPPSTSHPSQASTLLLINPASSLSPQDSTQPSPQDETATTSQETHYTTTASLRALTTLCTASGSFLTTRLEALFPSLTSLYLRTWSSVQLTLSRRKANFDSVRARTRMTDLELASSLSSSGGETLRGPEVEVWREMVRLFGTMLEYVSLKEEVGGEIAGWLADVVVFAEAENRAVKDGGGGGGGGGKRVARRWDLGVDVKEVRRVVRGYNREVLWLREMEAEAEAEAEEGKAKVAEVDTGLEGRLEGLKLMR
ncbi:MAG: hypothetical protein Q9227_007828 [Pyrenula ochraceoflavens]